MFEHRKEHSILIALVVIISAIAPVRSLSAKGAGIEGQSRYLLLDSRIIDKTENAKLTIGTVRKHKDNPLYKEDKPWEPRYDNLYPIIIYDKAEKLYKCWTSPFIIDSSTTDNPPEKRPTMQYQPRKREMAVCYTTSKDGIAWEKPELGIHEFNGSKKNNIVLRNSLGAGLMEDVRETDPAKRFKMLTAAPHASKTDMSVVFSPDGLHWGKLIPRPGINQKDHDLVDCINWVLWAPELGEYVAFTRLRGPSGGWNNIRQVGRTTSKDFLNWSEAKMIFEGSNPNLQVYSMPVFRHAGVYLGLPVMYDLTSDLAFTGLAWSPDTINWHFISENTPLIGTGKDMDDYDWGCVYSANPVFLEDEIRLYYGANNGRHYGWRDGFFCLATLRPDGFAGYEQIAGNEFRARVGKFEGIKHGYRKSTPSATVTTKPITVVGRSLCLSADVVRAGYVKVILFDKHNKKLAESRMITKTVTDAQVQWPRGFSFGSLKGSEIRFKFEIKNAKIYSFCFK